MAGHYALTSVKVYSGKSFLLFNIPVVAESQFQTELILALNEHLVSSESSMLLQL